MTAPLHLPARPGAPLACDLSTADDAAEERLAEYEELFQRALARRAIVLTFRAGPGVREQVDSLARREAACCPFAGYRVETDGAEVIWTIALPEDAEGPLWRAFEWAILGSNQ
jgi:hypothetical protein